MEKELSKTPLRDLLGDYKHYKTDKKWSVYPYRLGKFKIFFCSARGLPPNQTKIVDAPEALRRVFSKIKGGYTQVNRSQSFHMDLPEANICFDDLKQKEKPNGLLKWLNK